MAMMLAPYNDAMRLGMGFNSYTQTLCQDRAVLVTRDKTNEIRNPSQVVTYSSKTVTHLSEVVESFNVSHCTSIKKGTVEVAGNSNTINEDKIKESDINALVSVNVVNQTTITDDDCEFVPMDHMRPGTQAFNDAYGDCYISGFIEGGEFNGILSFRALNRTKKDQVVSDIKSRMGTADDDDFTFDMDSFNTKSESSSTDLTKDVESTISVSWKGGAQVKDPSVAWDIDSVFAAAAAFPGKVADVPQKTWAILTKYGANRSFNVWKASQDFSPLEYDAVASYTSELFDNYMEYKQLVRTIQDIIANPFGYTEQVEKEIHIPISVQSLVAARAAMRIEMSKIVEAVDTLTKDPDALKRNAKFFHEPSDPMIQAIIDQALNGTKVLRKLENTTSSLVDEKPNKLSSNGVNVTDATTAATTDPFGPKPPPTSSLPSSEGQETSTQGTAPINPVAAKPKAPAKRFDFTNMIAPEIWADLMPLANPDTPEVPEGSASTMPPAIADLFPKAPSDNVESGKTEPVGPAVEIHSAVLGVLDVTDEVRSWINTSDHSITFRGSTINTLYQNLSRVQHVDMEAEKTGMFNMSIPKLRMGDLMDYPTIPNSNWCVSLAFVYGYQDQPTRIFSAKAEAIGAGEDDHTQQFHITSTSTEYPTIETTPWTESAFSIVGVAYGGKTYQGAIPGIVDTMKSNWNEGRGYRFWKIDDHLINDDPAPNMKKTAVLFYTMTQGGRICAAAGQQGYTPCMLTRRLTPDVSDPAPPATLPA